MTVYTIIISIILCAITAIYVYQWKKKINRIVDIVDRIHGPQGMLLFGNVAELGAQPHQVYEVAARLRKDYGTIFRLWLLYRPVVVVSKAEYLEKILSSSKEIQKSFFYSFLHAWLGTGLLTSTGSKWHSHRKMITPTFHFTMLESFLEIFVDKSDKLLKCLQKITPGAEFDIYPMLTLATLDIICHTAMGVDLDAQQLHKKDSACMSYISAHTILTKALTEQMFRPWLWNNWIFYVFNSLGRQRDSALKTVHNFTLKVIAERKAARLKLKQMNGQSQTGDQFGIKKKNALLDVLLEASEEGSHLTDHEIREEVDTFMFEGNDTTSNGLAWALLLLGNHPDIQNKVVEELDSIFQGTNRRITSADLVEMKYLERVIKETLRLYPSVPAIARYLQNDLQLGDYLVPAGTELKLEFAVIQRDPEHYENPEVFNPDNFLPEKMRARHPYSYLAFSAGPRNCIGQKFALNVEKVVLASILRNFRVESVYKNEDVPRLTEMTLRPKDGIKMRIYPRSNQQQVQGR